MKQVYPVIFTQLNDKKDTVLINVPDMNILTEGFGLPDAIEMARDAIGANGITLQDLGREIPVPSDISDIDIKNGPFDNTGISHVSFVDIDFDEYRRRSTIKPSEEMSLSLIGLIRKLRNPISTYPAFCRRLSW